MEVDQDLYHAVLKKFLREREMSLSYNVRPDPDSFLAWYKKNAPGLFKASPGDCAGSAWNAGVDQATNVVSRWARGKADRTVQDLVEELQGLKWEG